MRPMTIIDVDAFDKVKVAIFDLTITDVNERREKRLIAESKALAVRVLGISGITRLETIIRNREHLQFQGKTVTLRYEHPNFDQPCQDTQSKTSKMPPQLSIANISRR